ncbi:MAG: ATP-binding protein [Lachnospiraceae bacterium]|nr:ATP-binding protein [Lachnospiraceae bacterium]
MNNNPFTIVFGKEPAQFISRDAQLGSIVEDFTSDTPASQVYMITGLRGIGKTVAMTNIVSRLASTDGWICISLNPERDMLNALASKIYTEGGLQKHFLKAKIDLSMFGLGVSVEDGYKYTDIESAISMMLKELGKRGKRVLVAVDEVVNNKDVRVFAASFQIMLRDNLPIYLLMTGLYENIYNLQNEKTLTFLYRAPKIALAPLNITAVCNKYEDIFGISHDKAWEMAILTKGYSFAFQVLGYLVWSEDAKNDPDAIIKKYDEYLEEYVYEKIWAELSEKDRSVLESIAMLGGEKVRIKDIRELQDMKSGELSVYKKRIEKKGLIDTTQYGYVSIVPPRFVEFIKRYS